MKKICYFPSPLGLLQIVEEEGSIIEISVVEEKSSEETKTPLLQKTKEQLAEYFIGKRREFTLPLTPKGTDFQKKVWKALYEIPYGETRSYQDIAKAVGNPQAVRAVGSANHKNPILLLIPCHRVVTKNGGLGGFACGVEKKKFLLNLEQDNVKSKS